MALHFDLLTKNVANPAQFGHLYHVNCRRWVTVIIYLSGDNFNPEDLKTNYGNKVIIRKVPGETEKYGKNRGEITKNGFCEIVFDETIKYENKIVAAVNCYNEIVDTITLDKLNIDYHDFKLLFTGCQGNMELNQIELKALSTIKSGITMDYVFSSKYDYNKQKKLKTQEYRVLF